MRHAFAAALALLCMACGQKGPLYLPNPARDTVPATTASPPSPADAAAATSADREDSDPNSTQKQKGSTAP